MPQNKKRGCGLGWGAVALALAASAATLSGCGGGGGEGAPSAARSSVAEPAPIASAAPPAAGQGSEETAGSQWSGSPSEVMPGQAGAPSASGDAAADALNWFNYRRAQSGLEPALARAEVGEAARGHSNYQALADRIGHGQEMGRPGFTGVDPGERLKAAGYPMRASEGYAYGEVISAASGIGGQAAAEELLAAIYHRFVALEPTFKDMGAGSAVSASKQRYVTVNFGSLGAASGLGAGRMAVYPADRQTGVPRWFKSDTEIPDPVPGKNVVGYPVSAHADMGSKVTVVSFTLRLQGSREDLPARLISSATDEHASDSAAAIVPLDPLQAGAVYEARFEGEIGSERVTRSWSFTTR